MRILIFDTVIYGHHLEYIHHLYIGMKDRPNEELVLVVPKAFEKEKIMYDWNEDINCKIVYLDDAEIAPTLNGNLLKCSYKRTLLLRKYIKRYHPDRVILIMLMMFMPFLAFMIPNNVKILGIVYKIYLYRWKKITFVRKCMEVGNYFLMKFCKSISTVFILNDRTAAVCLNRLYKTDKFVFLPDPFNEIRYVGRSLRRDYDINPNDTIYFHFGAMATRKGTMDVLKALEMLTEKEAKGKVFIFAGMVSESIKDAFYKKIDALNPRCRILLFDRFCKNEELADLCETSDFILCPYRDTDLSSGVLGFAAFHRKCVIGPSAGLIGKIIKKYKLGYAIPQLDAANLYKFIMQSPPPINCGERYLSVIRISAFVESIYSNI